MATLSHSTCCEAIWRQHPVLTRLLGMCPLLAVADRLVTGAAIGVLFVLALAWTQMLSSATRPFVPPAIAPVCQAIFAASGVTVLHLLLQAYCFELERELGIYVPVLAGCCLILARAEEFAACQPLPRVLSDCLAQGTGVLALVAVLAAIREALGFGTLLRDLAVVWPALTQWQGIRVLPGEWHVPIAVMPVGALFVFAGLLVAHRMFTIERDVHAGARS